MLYWEDYLELIDNLPGDMREQFTNMRELDLEVQNGVDGMDTRVKNLFKQCASEKGMSKESRDDEYEKISEGYQKAIDQSDEKVKTASDVFIKVERYMRKLDVELSKFKMELEADNAGITEILEKRSLELDNVPKENNPPRERRRHIGTAANASRGSVPASIPSSSRFQSNQLMGPPPHHVQPSSSTTSYYGHQYHQQQQRLQYNPQQQHQQQQAEKRLYTERALSSLAQEAARDVIGPSASLGSVSRSLGQGLSHSSTPSMFASPSLSVNIGSVGSQSNAAIEAAARGAIQAVGQMNQGRRSMSLKASYEFVGKKNVSASTAPVTPRGSGTQGTDDGAGLGGSGTGAGFSTPTMQSPRDNAHAGSSGGSERSHRVKKPTQKASALLQAQQQAQRSKQEAQAKMVAASVSTGSLVSELGASGGLLTLSGSGSGLGSMDVGVGSLEPEAVETVEEGPAPVVPMEFIDPNELRYCNCNQVSYGDMVGCDNEDCPIEWFHYGCVNLTGAPKGKWYCPGCQAAMKRRGRR